MRRGFIPVEIMIVRHGQHKNDTLVIVEQRDKRLVDANDEDIAAIKAHMAADEEMF
jgi:hypothetical protein